MSIKSSRVLDHLSSSILCAKKLSSMNFRNLLDCLHSSVLLLHETLKRLKSRHPGSVNVRFIPILWIGIFLFPSWSGDLEQTSSMTLPTLVCCLILMHKFSAALLSVPKQNLHRSCIKGNYLSSPSWMIYASTTVFQLRELVIPPDFCDPNETV